MFRKHFGKIDSFFCSAASHFIRDLVAKADENVQKLGGFSQIVRKIRPINTTLVLASTNVDSDHSDVLPSLKNVSFNDQSDLTGTSLERMDEEQLKEFTHRQHIANVDVMGIDPEHLLTLRRLLTVKAGGQHTEQEVSIDVQRLMMTGDFSNVGIKMEYSSGGLNVVYLVEPYFELKKVMVIGTQCLSARVAESMFRSQMGRRMNLNQIFGTLARMEKWCSRAQFV